MRRKSRKKNSILKIIFLGFIAVLLVYILFFRLHIFDIGKVEIKTQKINCVNEQTLKESLKIEGMNFFTLNTEELTKNIKLKFFCVKDVKFSKVFPNKIKLETIPRQVFGQIVDAKQNIATSSSDLESLATPSAELASEYFLIDTEGVLFEKNPYFLNIPTIYAYDLNLSLGKKLEENKQVSLKILDKLNLFKVNINSSAIFDNFFVIYSTPKIIFKLDNTADTQLASLQLILEKAKIDSEQLTFVDLRFDKPIVRFAPKKK